MDFQYDSSDFVKAYTYNGSDLGATYHTKRTCFRLWAPTAEDVFVRLYRSGDPDKDDCIEQIPMQKSICGTWVVEKIGDLNGIYYTYTAKNNGKYVQACDPYARATGINGARAMVIDLASTNPINWEKDRDPNFGIRPTDMLIYEAHIRDLSMDDQSGITQKGKFLGVCETGTHTTDAYPTGIGHMKSLGVTHLHLLPVFDYGFTDERDAQPQYNWGYDPVNFNVPEGSYASDAFDGAVRVREMKQMVKSLHDAGISVVMDVVYNHVYDAEDFCFNKLVPMYFSRTNENGSLTNDSCCGNDTASEHEMVRKYIVDSVKYWADEYHIDGFRFDLVGLIDVETIRQTMAAVHSTHPNVIFYGEGWDMYTGKAQCMTTQKNAALVPGFAFFNDTIRDMLKGATFYPTTPGFVSGKKTDKVLLEMCYRGQNEWCQTPMQSVNYISCHDNHTLFDRIALATPNVSRAKRVKMNCLAAAFCITAQGIPFMQAGEEFLRSKPLTRRTFDENSYRSPDSINSIKWGNLGKDEYRRTLEYYKGLLAIRRAFSAIRDDSRENRHALECDNDSAIAFSIADELCVIFNAGNEAFPYPLPDGKWDILAKGTHAATTPLGHAKGSVLVPAISAMILRRNG